MDKKDIENMFKDVFSDLTSLSSKEEKIEEKIEEDIFSYIDNVFSRLNEFQRRFNIVDENIVNRSIQMLLDKYDLYLTNENNNCNCGSKFNIKFISRRRKINFSDIDYYTPFNDSFNYRYHRFLFVCPYCKENIIISSTDEIVGVIEMNFKKELGVK